MPYPYFYILTSLWNVRAQCAAKRGVHYKYLNRNITKYHIYEMISFLILYSFCCLSDHIDRGAIWTNEVI